jgi:transcriptional regulator with GAF, ATPase, and Fis domain
VNRLQTTGTVSVLIQGESGTGKELIARAIHFGGPRAKKPFIAVNCSAVPKELAESEFFGHTKGAFTGANADKKGYFELSDGGTLFLDEIGDMPLELQAKLLRVLEDGVVTSIGGRRDKKVDVKRRLQ